ncbi:hypothetical protein GCM10022255_071390 [Dactylosporangium darangshiense]|uniref:Uncharacterized protein n=1 Tax=Dactylosporangium darangshiense TaxID=579108 RepID=A0ABP8DIF8_9ACTN
MSDRKCLLRQVAAVDSAVVALDRSRSSRRYGRYKDVLAATRPGQRRQPPAPADAPAGSFRLRPTGWAKIDGAAAVSADRSSLRNAAGSMDVFLSWVVVIAVDNEAARCIPADPLRAGPRGHSRHRRHIGTVRRHGLNTAARADDHLYHSKHTCRDRVATDPNPPAASPCCRRLRERRGEALNRVVPSR